MQQASRSSARCTGLLAVLAVCAAGSSVLAQSSLPIEAVSPVNYFVLDAAAMQDEAASSSASRSRSRRHTDAVSRTPAVMGDFFGGGIPIPATEVGQVGVVPVGSRHSKIGENGQSLPVDRVFFAFNRFENALSTSFFDTSGNPQSAANDVNQYTFGYEKTFFDGLWSGELRMSLTSDLSSPIMRGGNVGNLTLNLKRSVYRTETTSMVVGLGTTFPTGSDTRFILDGDVIFNEAYHLMPFVGILRTPSDRFFYQFLAQVDLPVSKDRYFVAAGPSYFRLTEANWLYLDLSAGYWLYQDYSRDYLPGMAAILELHSSSVLSQASGTTFSIPSIPNFLSLTAGLNVQVTEMTNLRIGGAVPLTRRHDLFFDGEFFVQLNRYF